MPSEFTYQDLLIHNTRQDCLVAIHGKVYSVGKFIHEHPGGDILLEFGGKDATDAFEDIGHSDEARERMKSLFVGVLKRSPGDGFCLSKDDTSILKGEGIVFSLHLYAFLLLSGIVVYSGYKFVHV